MKDVINLKKGKKTNKKINKRKMAIVIFILVALVVVGITMLIYYSSRDARKFLDQYLFRKNVTQEKLDTIDLDYTSDTNVFAYNKYICILAENKLMQYNSSGNLVNEIELQINSPVYSVNNKYIAISEQNGTELYLISDTQILWTKNIDGNISKINVNNDGYVSVILTGTTYKSVITTFDKNGNELFKTYQATTSVVDTAISNDNKYLAFAEVNTSGTAIQSYIKIIPIENPSSTGIYTYTADSNKLIINIEYSGNDKIICMFDDEITVLQDGNNSTLLSFREDNKNINFANINLDGYVYRAIEESEGLFNTNTVLEIRNVNNDNTNVYTVEGASKYIYSYNNIIAVNLGQEVEFINTSAWLVKSYSSTQEAQSIVIGNGIAGIVYSDRVEIINL